MKHTKNYNLNQWEATDKVQRTDFNADNAKIDAALTALAAGKGNCNILTGSYTGTGSTSCTLTFPAGFQPKIIFVGGIHTAVLIPGVTGTTVTGAGTATTYHLSVTWGENRVSWSTHSDADTAMNYEGRTYYYVMFR